MWTGAFLERVANMLPALVSADLSKQYSLFKGIYDEFLGRPTYGRNFYQELASRTGGSRRRRQTRRARTNT